MVNENTVTEENALASQLVNEGENDIWALPAPWVFDGTRRLYEEGKPVGWIARAVDNSTHRQTKGLSTHAPLRTGEGRTPYLATLDLVRRMTL